MATVSRLFNNFILADSTGQPIGLMGADGREWLLPVLTQNATPATAQSSAYVPATVAITGGTINGTSIGATTRAAGSFSTLAVTRSDSTGTPGNVTNNNALGRAAIAAAATSCVVTNSTVTANSEVFVELISSDATLTSVRVTVAAGSFTVTGNAAATATTSFRILVVN
jgi:hypothetical protein